MRGSGAGLAQAVGRSTAVERTCAAPPSVPQPAGPPARPSNMRKGGDLKATAWPAAPCSSQPRASIWTAVAWALNAAGRGGGGLVGLPLFAGQLPEGVNGAGSDGEEFEGGE